MAFALGKLEAGRLAAVHAHLDECETCQRVLAEAAHALATAVTAQPEHGETDWNTTFQRGTVVGERYEIREFVARGGMGEVYEAFDRELRERVALKTVASTACDNSRAVRRLKGEVQLARRVSHPNVCRIYDLGSHVMPTTRTQIHFLTMEFVDGETLGQRVRLRGAIPVAEARKLARQLLLALRAAHEAGVLHRDFKSDNVMLKSGPDEQSSAVVLDFGLARALDHEQAASASNPHLVGTFGYMAPEQIEGQPHSTASDVYAFGVVWFEMLTGQLPFQSTSSVLQAPAPVPSSINPEIPRKLDALVLRCLERAPGNRHQRIDDVLAALDSLTDPPPARSRARVLGPAILAACTGVAIAYFLLRSLTTPTSKSTEPRQRTPQPVATAAEQVPPAPDPALALATHSAPAAASANVSVPRLASKDARPRHQQATHRSPAERGPLSAGQEDSEDSTPPVVSTPVSSATPAAPATLTTTPQPKKPDWENPFGAVDSVQLMARSKSAT